LIVFHEVVQEFGHRLDTRNQQVIASASAGDIKQVALSVVDFPQIGIVADRLDALLLGNYFIITGHHSHGPELKPLREVHGAD
jgi:hypothetical protein